MFSLSADLTADVIPQEGVFGLSQHKNWPFLPNRQGYGFLTQYRQ
jgi:hypothetical protein